ncbi:type IV pilin protein [Acinetobacter sp. ULE_I010]|uniref:type IV pilin protein n=1 Tax=Acinetobacter sp. ULE_I010 TaxID=3373065 RepID=UPI003AF7E2B9
MKNNPAGKTDKNQFNQGFTLIELMVIVVIIAIFTAIAIPSYQHFVRRGNVAQAQQEVSKIAEQLQRYKSRNFSFKGFNANYLYPSNTNFNTTTQVLNLNSKYEITLVDNMTGNPLLTDSDALGQAWSIKAISQDINNYSLLLTSTGVRCKNLTKENIDYDSCGSGTEEW